MSNEPTCQTCYDMGEVPTPSRHVYLPCHCQTVVVTEYDLREGHRYTTRKVKAQARREWPEMDVAREVEVAPDGTETVIYDRTASATARAYLAAMGGL